MFKNNENPKMKEFNSIIMEAYRDIVNAMYDDARELLKKASSFDVESPIIYNLLGIIYEKNRDYSNACKYYRVAYYMDQSFKAASENLDRINDVYYKGFGDVSWGLEGLGGTAK